MALPVFSLTNLPTKCSDHQALGRMEPPDGPDIDGPQDSQQQKRDVELGVEQARGNLSLVQGDGP